MYALCSAEILVGWRETAFTKTMGSLELDLGAQAATGERSVTRVDVMRTAPPRSLTPRPTGS
jgi:hypothetical protein